MPKTCIRCIDYIVSNRRSRLELTATELQSMLAWYYPDGTSGYCKQN